MKNKPYPYYTAPEINNLQELTKYCAEKFNEKTAFHYLNKSTEVKKTYIDFYNDVAALCNYFIKQGYNRAHISLLGENSYEWLVSFFAIVNSDNIVVPLDKELVAAELSSIIAKSDSSVLIYSNDYKEEAQVNTGIEQINMVDLPIIISEHKTAMCSDLSFYDNIKIDNSAVCAIVYTSGTTSEPKGVMLSHKNIVSDALFSYMNARIPDTSMLVLPLHHTYALTIAINLPLLYGTSIFINKNLRTLMSDIKYCKPGYIAVVPLMLEIFYKKIINSLEEQNKSVLINKLLLLSNILKKAGIDLRRKIFAKIIEALGGNLKLIAVGGAPINGETVAAFIDFGINVLGGYGTSECSPIVSFVRDKHYNPYSCGTILPNVEARIINEELQVKGDIVFSGYYKDIEATKQVFDEKWYKTGDIGIIKDGFLYIKGRLKNIIVLSNGENISPESLESLLYKKIQEIEEVIIRNEDDAIVAEIYSSSLNSEIKEKILEDIDVINKEIPAYKQISKVIFREHEFEKTTTKKIKRI